MGQACPLCGTTIDEPEARRKASLCQPCSRALLPFSNFLESMSSPAAVVARDLTIVFSNSHLCGIAEKCGKEAVGLKVGEALGCKHAGETRVCGQSDACDFCWLRRSVDLARISGEKLPDIPLDFTPKNGIHRSFKITAENAGNAVVLTIRPQNAAAANGML